MFNKKRNCKNCNKKVEKDFDFCPYCGKTIINGDYGLLGKSDESDLNNIFEENLQKNFGGSILDKMLSNAMKMLQKEINQLNIEEKNLKNIEKDHNLNSSIPKTRFQIYINGKKIPINSEIQQYNLKKQEGQNKPLKISEELIKNSVKLPRKEAKTKLIRLKDKVIYELKTPGLNSLEEVLINRLEQSLEIKVYTNKAGYHNNLAVKLPLTKYYTKEEKLFLEFKVN